VRGGLCLPAFSHSLLSCEINSNKEILSTGRCVTPAPSPSPSLERQPRHARAQTSMARTAHFLIPFSRVASRKKLMGQLRLQTWIKTCGPGRPNVVWAGPVDVALPDERHGISSISNTYKTKTLHRPSRLSLCP
jgi:hypothetical protein